MRDIEFCTQILKLDDGWSVTGLEIDEPSNRIDITVSYGASSKRSFFKRSTASDEQTKMLRHLPLLGMRTYLTVPIASVENGNKTWSYVSSKLTEAMEDTVLSAIRTSTSIQGVSDITGLTPSDIREVSERTGVAIERRVIQAESNKQEIPLEETIAQSFELTEMEDIPTETHPNWMRFIQGQLILPSNAVGLKMLLQRIRQEITATPTETSKLAGIRLLRQFFIKNQATHRADIDILNGSVAFEKTRNIPNLAVIQGGLPGEQHECWQHIISGEKKIETIHVGLQMMIERVRLSVENSPSEASRHAGAKILRQFFLKHKNRLQNELNQLGVETQPQQMEATITMPVAVTVPATNHQCWQKLLSGSLDLNTNAVGLQMMLERVRMSIQRNPTESNHAAGVKILHQYFLKHQARHREEILALLGNVVATPSDDSHIHIPSESHPNWQRLINGELEIMTDVVALKMMLERIRISVEKNPTDATRLAGAKILRQYFIKHQLKHRAELNQLIAA